MTQKSILLALTLEKWKRVHTCPKWYLNFYGRYYNHQKLETIKISFSRGAGKHTAVYTNN